MNEFDLENELRTLRPVSPSPDLETAIARELEKPRLAKPISSSGVVARPRDSFLDRLLPGLCWASAGAAAAIAVLSLNLEHIPSADVQPAEPRTVTTIAENLFEPEESSRELVGTEDGGLIYTADEEPTRIVRYNSMERHVWANPSTGARVEVEVPREDVVLVPVAFQ